MALDVLGTRVPVHYYVEAYSVPAVDALVPSTGLVRGNAAAVTTQLAVTTGKVLRVNRIIVTGVLLGATVTATTLRLRANLTPGAATLTSAIWWTCRVASAPGTLVANLDLEPLIDVFPEGMEFPAGTGLQFAAVATTAAMHSITVALYGFEYTNP